MASSNGLYQQYKKVSMVYYCPLGEEKFNVDEIKYRTENLELIDNLKDKNAKKIAEDDEFEYYEVEE